MICPFCSIDMEPIDLAGKLFCSNCGMTIYEKNSQAQTQPTHQIIKEVHTESSDSDFDGLLEIPVDSNTKEAGNPFDKDSVQQKIPDMINALKDQKASTAAAPKQALPPMTSAMTKPAEQSSSNTNNLKPAPIAPPVAPATPVQKPQMTALKPQTPPAVAETTVMSKPIPVQEPLKPVPATTNSLPKEALKTSPPEPPLQTEAVNTQPAITAKTETIRVLNEATAKPKPIEAITDVPINKPEIITAIREKELPHKTTDNNAIIQTKEITFSEKSKNDTFDDLEFRPQPAERKDLSNDPSIKALIESARQADFVDKTKKSEEKIQSEKKEPVKTEPEKASYEDKKAKKIDLVKKSMPTEKAKHRLTEAERKEFDKKTKELDTLSASGILLDILDDEALSKKNEKKVETMKAAADMIEKIDLPTEKFVTPPRNEGPKPMQPEELLKSFNVEAEDFKPKEPKPTSGVNLAPVKSKPPDANFVPVGDDRHQSLALKNYFSDIFSKEKKNAG